MLNAIANLGVDGAAAELSLPVEQLHNGYRAGMKAGLGTEEEYRLLVGQMVQAELNIQQEVMKLSDWLDIARQAAEFIQTEKPDYMMDREETSLAIDDEGAAIPKFETGFMPLDMILHGMYNGICTVVGLPGEGKTSMMLLWMHLMRSNPNNHIEEVWFYESEITKSMMLYKTAPLRRQFQYGQNDRLVTGDFTMREIMDDIRRNPNPNRAVFIDGPDVMAGGTGEGKRYALETIYRNLVWVKQRSAVVVVSSQSKRGMRGDDMSQEDVSDSFDKSRYSDMIVLLKKYARAPGNKDAVRMKVGKNRFGPSGEQTTVHINYDTFDWVLPNTEAATQDGEDW
jgi:hypothetical protein